MFNIREDDYFLRIMGIDNGSSNLGAVVIDLDLRTGVYHLLHANTFVAEKLIKNHRGNIISHGARWARQCTLQDSLADLLNWWQPDAVPVEDKFFRPGRVLSFEVLTEMMVKLRDAVEDYCTGMNIVPISPGEAKKAVQPSNFTMKKAVIKDCVLSLPNLKYSNEINLDNLTEHEYDAIAVSIAYGDRVRRDTGFVR